MSNKKNITGYNFLHFTVHTETMVLLVTFINKLNDVSFQTQTLRNVDIVYICFMYDFFKFF